VFLCAERSGLCQSGVATKDREIRARSSRRLRRRARTPVQVGPGCDRLELCAAHAAVRDVLAGDPIRLTAAYYVGYDKDPLFDIVDRALAQKDSADAPISPDDAGVPPGRREARDPTAISAQYPTSSQVRPRAEDWPPRAKRRPPGERPSVGSQRPMARGRPPGTFGLPP
jgi:hypothetical protein